MASMTTEIAVMPRPRVVSVRRLAIIVSLLLVLGAAAAALFLVNTVDQQIEDIDRTYQVGREARELMLVLVDAETGQRGYVLTQEPAYLEPYRAAIRSLDATYNALVELVRGNISWTQQVSALAVQIEAKRTDLASIIELVDQGQVAEAIAIMRSSDRQASMDAIRASLRTLIAAEDANLVARNERVQSYRQLLFLALIAALVAAVILAYALFSRSQRQVRALSGQQSTLLTEKEKLEQHVRARTAEVEEARAHAERERARVEALLQETNHRIGNSLATVSSLLGLQMSRSKSEDVREALEAAQNRVQAIASGHRRLRLGDDLDSTDAGEFLDAVIDDLQATLPAGKPVVIHKDLQSLVIPARDATTIGIVVGELITNALKHAFPEGRDGQIWVRFAAGADGVPMLTISDDGLGMRGPGPGESGLGAMIIQQLARQFGGAPSYAQREGGGTTVSVTLPALRRD